MADLPPEVRDDIGLLEGHCESFQWLTPVVQNVRNYCERVTADAARNALLAGRNGTACSSALDRAEKAEAERDGNREDADYWKQLATKAMAERDALRKRIAEAPKACMSGDAHIVMLTGEMYLHIHEPCFKFKGFPGKRVALVVLGDDDG